MNVGMTEDQLLVAVLALAKAQGWQSLHIRPPASARSIVQGDGKGFPDLLLLRGPRLLAVELKSATGTLTSEQIRWLALFELVGAEVGVWRPADWPTLIPAALAR